MQVKQKWLKQNNYSVEGLHRDMFNEMQAGLRDAYADEEIKEYTLDDIKDQKRLEEQQTSPQQRDIMDSILQLQELNK